MKLNMHLVETKDTYDVDDGCIKSRGSHCFNAISDFRDNKWKSMSHNINYRDKISNEKGLECTISEDCNHSSTLKRFDYYNSMSRLFDDYW